MRFWVVFYSLLMLLIMATVCALRDYLWWGILVLGGDLETQTRIFLYRNLKSHNVTKSRLKILYTNTLLMNYFISAKKKKFIYQRFCLVYIQWNWRKHLQLLSIYMLSSVKISCLSAIIYNTPFNPWDANDLGWSLYYGHQFLLMADQNFGRRFHI